MKKFTALEDDIIRELYDKIGPQKISRALNRAGSSVSSRANILGLFGNRGHTDHDIETIKENYYKGWDYCQSILPHLSYHQIIGIAFKYNIKTITHTKRMITKHIPARVWGKITYSATRRKIDFALTPQEADDIWVKQGGFCILSGLKIVIPTMWNDRIEGFTYHDMITASGDRIDSDGIYEASNFQWVHQDLNIMKGPLPEDKFRYYCRKVLEHVDRPSTEQRTNTTSCWSPDEDPGWTYYGR